MYRAKMNEIRLGLIPDDLDSDGRLYFNEAESIEGCALIIPRYLPET